MTKRLTKHERAVHAARVKANSSANYARECATNGASPERLTRAKVAAERDATALATLLEGAVTTLKCAMGLGECSGEVTHIDDKGYVYCTGHGERRRCDGVRKCRALRPAEITKLTIGQTIKY